MISLLEKESGEVLALRTGDIETRISVVGSTNGRYILAIDAPPDTELEHVVPDGEKNSLKQALRASYRHELLMF